MIIRNIISVRIRIST